MAKPIKKDTADILDYRVLWSDDTTWDPTDKITASAFTVTAADSDDTPLTVDSDSFTDTVATVWLSEGTTGTTYTVVNHITTDAGREMDKQFQVLITDTAR